MLRTSSVAWSLIISATLGTVHTTATVDMSRSATITRNDLRDIARRAMLARGLLPDFSSAVLAEASRLPADIRETGPAIRDLRGLPWVSIDNDDSRDLDQLSVAEPLPGGATRILVAVADVDAAVAQGSAIDGHARTNTTSIYTAAGVFPMLPPTLSTDRTSLNEGEERMAVITAMVFDATGAVTESDVYRAVVLNRAQLAYPTVAAWLDRTGPPPPGVAAVPGLEEQLHIQDRVAQAMKGLRHRHGALSLETAESAPVFDHDVLTDLQPDEKNRAKELIEDFMIAANTASATYLGSRGLPSFRRILRAPKRWDRIVELATQLRERLPQEPSAEALQAFLTRRHQADPARFSEVSLSVVKLLGSGEYVVERPGETTGGHFGLAVKDYTHSTAPNRRFPDLVTQRLLKAAMTGRAAPYTLDELTTLARHCTVQEDGAAKVERQVRKSAAALLLASRVGEQFSGIVTGASAKGTWVRIPSPPVEGRLVRRVSGLDVGDAVRVKLAATDVERGFIDFVPAPGDTR